jgi:hypothetical protein
MVLKVSIDSSENLINGKWPNHPPNVQI